MVEAVMLWNEPNNLSHWDFTIDKDWKIFAEMSIAAAQAIRKLNPELTKAPTQKEMEQRPMHQPNKRRQHGGGRKGSDETRHWRARAPSERYRRLGGQRSSRRGSCADRR